MSRKKKKNKKPVQTQQGGYKRFLNDANEVMCLLGLNDILGYFPNDLKREIYKNLYSIKNPKIGNGYISSNEQKIITDKIKKKFREKSFHLDNKYISAYQLHLYSCCSWAYAEIYKKTYKDQEEENIKQLEDIAQKATDLFHRLFLIDFFKIGSSLSSPDFKYYLIETNPIIDKYNDHRFTININIYGVPSQKRMFTINGYNRPTYRLGKSADTNNPSWLKIKTSLLGNFYNGEKQEIDIYIQSHAIKRLSERLDLLDKEAINYSLYENTCSIDKVEIYNEYIYSPFKIFGIKVGYLLANVIDDKLLFRTFLFITHNSTPEGDRLKEVTGLEKNDISYWKIDRLSTFKNIDNEKHLELISFFKDAGLEELIQLKDKDFNVEKMQETNLDGFMDFLIKSKESMALIASDESNLVEIN